MSQIIIPRKKFEISTEIAPGRGWVAALTVTGGNLPDSRKEGN